MSGNEIDTYIPISDVEEEALVLGTVMFKRDVFHIVSGIIDEEAFTLPLHKDVWKAMKSLASEGNPIEPMLIARKVNSDGDRYSLATIAGLGVETLMFDDEVEAHSRRLHDLAMRRSFRTIALRLLVASTNEHDEISDIVTGAIDSLSTGFKADDGIRTMQDNLTEVWHTMCENLDPERKTGTPTGFSEYDRRTGGFFPSDLIIIAADSSQGKTSFTQEIILSSGEAGHPVAVYSLEMTGAQMAARYLASRSGVPSSRIMRQHLRDDEFKAVESKIDGLLKLPIYTDDRSTSTLDGIIASIRSLKIKKGIKGAVIDFVQILSVSMRNYNQDIFLGEIARKLKNLAKDLGIWIVMVSQLSRDKENPEPTVYRLRGSGQMNEAADVTILLYRAEVYKRRYPEPYERYNPSGTAMVRVAKTRNAGTFDFFVGFDAATTRFHDLLEIPASETDTGDDEPF